MNFNSAISSIKNKLFRIFNLLIFLLFSYMTYGQKPIKWTSSEIYENIEKLGFLGSVLYVAAHPDDENTRLISYFANSQKAYTTYLSLTRGDGGQNLIGPEMSELLGVIRTQELLMARSIDNGNQLFSRANDFGFSKNAEETIAIWDTEKVKSDVIWAIRKSRPDVIINRFDHRTSGQTHGHHTASALLSYELFDKASDKNIHPEQCQFVQPWQAKRLFFNTSWWFYGSEDKFKKADKSALMSLDLGVFFPFWGKSNTEIAAESRSMHKCQGFGSTGSRGSQLEYLELLKGDMPPHKSDVFEGINTTWSRVENGAPIQKMIDQTLASFDYQNPSKSTASLIKIYQAIQKINDPFWKNIKTAEIKELILAVNGLYLEAKSDIHKAVPNENIKIDFEIINRSETKINLVSIKGIGISLDSTLHTNLMFNEIVKWTKPSQIPENTALTAPYWLTQKGSLGLYHVDNQELIGRPQTPRSLRVIFNIEIDGVIIPIEKDVIYKFNSPENGETYRPLEIVPPLSVKIESPVYIFNDEKPKEIKVIVHAWDQNQSGELSIPLPNGWECQPKSVPFTIDQKGESKSFVFSIKPPNKGEEIDISPMVLSKGKAFSNEIIEINYDHIPYQTVVKKAFSKLSKIDLVTPYFKIGYIAGAGDEIPSSLQQIGYQVDIIKVKDISPEKLSLYQTLVIGIRAYNTEEDIKFKQKDILDFVHQGGTCVVQYNTGSELVTKELGPYPLVISRKRVSVEDAEMRFLAPTHPILNYPNKITQKDFEGWVQERGLYFPDEWDPAYTPILSCNDPGESANDGVILVTDYGKGHYIYTGLSFFRELPAGVSGAFRLFTNLISYGHAEQP